MTSFRFLRSIAAVGSLLFVLSLSGYGQGGGPYENARRLVGRVQENVKRAAEFDASSAKERERIDNAMKHLSEFDRELAKNHYDKGILDSAIGDVQNIVDHNTISPRDRNTLTHDLEELRSLRANKGTSY